MGFTPSPAKQRVLVVSNLFPPHVLGGAEIVAQRQALQLQARGHAVSVFAGWIAPPGHAGRLEVEDQGGLRIWRVPLQSFRQSESFFVPSLAARFRSVLLAERPTLVHFHNLSGLGWSLISAVRQAGIAMVVTLHDHAGYCYRGTVLRPDGSACADTEECGVACAANPDELPIRLRRDYIAWSLDQPTHLIAPSVALAASYRKAGIADPSRLKIVSNGIDLAQFDTPRSDGPLSDSSGCVRFACMASLTDYKGIPDLLDAATLLAADESLAGRWSLTIAGDGYLREHVQARVAEPPLAGVVRCAGYLPRERIIAELARTDVVVLPSRWPENEPVVLLEAIAAGVAQLATSTGGTPELIEPGVTGELVPPGNPPALAAAMAGYIRDQAKARRHGEANRARRDRFSEQATMDMIEALYASLRQPRPPAPAQRKLVLCAGGRPSAEARTICDSLYRLEEPGPGIRLIRHEWADPALWPHASLLWQWGPDADFAVMRRALQAGVPILAPRSCAVAQHIADGFGAAFTYGTHLEGMVALARIPHQQSTLARLRRNCAQAALVVAAATPAAHHHLPAPVLAA